MNNLTLDAAQCLLMAKVASKMYAHECSAFWETLPDIIPDLTAHLPALSASVGEEKRVAVLSSLSSHPLPTTLSPEGMNWRQELVTSWEKQAKQARESLDTNTTEPLLWKHKYIYSLRGLMRVDRCSIPPGIARSSVLPTLLNGARYVHEKFTGRERFKCLATLARWRPAQNVITKPTVLNEWRDFWMELYQKGMPADFVVSENDPVVMQGIAAQALLNLLETGSEKETGVPMGMDRTLLESLAMAIAVPGGIREGNWEVNYSLNWLRWQPQDVSRFSTDRLAELPQALLKRFKLSYQDPDRSWSEQQVLTWIARWDRAGLLADCGTDLLPHVVTEINNYLKQFRGSNYFMSERLLNYELCRWLVRDEVANVQGGRELLQKLESHWRYECRVDCDELEDPRPIAWYGRIQLHRTGLATETAADFLEGLLEAIERDNWLKTRPVLSLWKPGKDAPDSVRRRWMCFCEEGLKLNDETISGTAALALLGPNPAADPVDPVARWQKLRGTLHDLPEELRQKLSITEITQLTGEFPLANPNAAPGVDSSSADSNRGWQFKSEEMRFRIPTERIASVSTPETVRVARPDADRTTHRSAGREWDPGR